MPALPASTTPNMDAPDHYQMTYDSKTKIVVFYSLITCCCICISAFLLSSSRTRWSSNCLWKNKQNKKQYISVLVGLCLIWLFTNITWFTFLFCIITDLSPLFLLIKDSPFFLSSNYQFALAIYTFVIWFLSYYGRGYSTIALTPPAVLAKGTALKHSHCVCTKEEIISLFGAKCIQSHFSCNLLAKVVVFYED